MPGRAFKYENNEEPQLTQNLRHNPFFPSATRWHKVSLFFLIERLRVGTTMFRPNTLGFFADAVCSRKQRKSVVRIRSIPVGTASAVTGKCCSYERSSDSSRHVHFRNRFYKLNPFTQMKYQINFSDVFEKLLVCCRL